MAPPTKFPRYGSPSALRRLSLAIASALAIAACDTGDIAIATDGFYDTTLQEESEPLRYKLYFTNPLPNLIERNIEAFSGDNRAEAEAIGSTIVGDGARPDEALVALIDGAEGSGCAVLVADYDFDLQAAADALVRAKARGCDVRMITDGDTIDRSDPTKPHGRKDFKPEYEQPFRTLREAGVEIRHDGSRAAIMHNKYVVVNKARVWTGSWNMSVDDTSMFWNNAIELEHRGAARMYEANFERLWATFEPGRQRTREAAPEIPDPAAHTVRASDATMELYFPRAEPALQRLADFTRSAQQSVHFMAFVLTAEPIGDALIEKATEGVDVFGILENSGACSGQFARLSTLPEEVSEHVSIRRWIYGPTNFMHQKAIVVDGKKVALGSFNFSKAANTKNDENVVIIENEEIARTFTQAFELIGRATMLHKEAPACNVYERPSRPPSNEDDF